MIAFAVDSPLQGVAEEAFVIVEHDGLHQLGRGGEGDALHEADVLHAVVTLAGALRHVEQGEGIVLNVTLGTEESDVGVIFLRPTGERELAQQLEAVGTKAVEGGLAGVLEADEVVTPDGHTLIALPRHATQIVDLLHLGARVIRGPAGDYEQ